MKAFANFWGCMAIAFVAIFYYGLFYESSKGAVLFLPVLGALFCTFLFVRIHTSKAF